ncbi:MAG: dihydroorotate dehydrogenase electron transfer subunit [Deltaproteobacteria bacterium]|nr:dihydroorotate dehydrogenase electron transfer subunit [Deltaproteobacteria bacterium]
MQTKILYNKQILPLYYKIGINWQPLPNIQPGQFVMLHFTNYIDPLLRRPFGVYRIIDEGIEILYKVVGKGTRLMTGLRQGDMVDMLGPLGNGFPNSLSSPFANGGQRGLNILMVAGGIGIAPFYLLAESCQLSAISLKLLFGGRGKDDLPDLEDFKKLDIAMEISTQDGSVGKKGLVTDLLKKEVTKKDDCVVYACGPKGMLKEVAKIAEDADVPCHVSLDNAMACGMGACLGCAVKVRSQKSGVRGQGSEGLNIDPRSPIPDPVYKMVCKDGPVFDAREIEWEKV